MMDLTTGVGQSIHSLARRLWPLNRSITGEGVRETLRILREIVPELRIHEVPSGTQVFDWDVPKEWNVREAWIEAPDGTRVVDWSANNLHLVGYSIAVDQEVSLAELQTHLYSLPEQPDAIPYITSYYAPRWGFCLAHRDRERLADGTYRVRIDSSLEPGSLTYGEALLPGETDREVLISTYICHPSMANNELSGPCVSTYIASWVKSLTNHRYTYRFVFIPETIGSITYLSRNLDHLKHHVIAGFNLTCIGDDRAYSYLPSRAGDSLSDKAALHVLRHVDADFRRYSYLDRGSDERQYCSPGVDLPIATLSRSIYGSYPEYHTSRDDLSLVTPSGLEGGFVLVQRAIQALEENCFPTLTVLCEPQLGKRGLYPEVSTKQTLDEVRSISDLIGYSDGKLSLLEIAETIDVPMWELVPLCRKLVSHKLLTTLPA